MPPMDLFEIRLQEELDFWKSQIEMAEKAQDENILPRLRDALNLVEFKLERYRGPDRSTMMN
jgi:hypothetical protein